MATPSRPDAPSLPSFLGRGTAVVLTTAPAAAGTPPAVAAGRPVKHPAELDESARRLGQELQRRLACGETRLWEEELVAALSVSPSALGPAFTALRQAGLVDWDAAGAYLYLSRLAGDPSPGTGDPGGELAQVYQALEAATGLPVSSAQEDRMREWLVVLGLRDVLDEIGLCRERRFCRFNQISFALDKACSRRRRVSPFGTLDGRGILRPAPGEAGGEGGAVGGPEPLANATAYDPVPPERVQAWVAAHPELYADPPPAPPPEPTSGRRATAARASAYDPVPAEAVRRWADAFPGEYDEYRREYLNLARAAKPGPFRSRRSRS